MINWQYYPKYSKPTEKITQVRKVFEKNYEKIKSEDNNFGSNDILNKVKKDLEVIGFKIENGKKQEDKINVPVLYGLNGTMEKYFDADGFHEEEQIVIEVEAGRAFTNYQFLKDLFQASVMQDTKFLIIAVRNVYRNSKDFEKINKFMDTLYSSDRLNLPLDGIMIIGY